MVVRARVVVAVDDDADADADDDGDGDGDGDDEDGVNAGGDGDGNNPKGRRSPRWNAALRRRWKHYRRLTHLLRRSEPRKIKRLFNFILFFIKFMFRPMSNTRTRKMNSLP